MKCMVPLLALLVATLSPASAEDMPLDAAPGATLRELLDWVDARNPDLAAMRFEVEAAKARVQPAGAFADPMFRIELQGIDKDDPSLDPSRVGATKYTLSQGFPFWGKRDLRRDVARAEVDAADGRQRATRVEIHSAVKTVFTNYFFARKAHALTAQVLDLMRDLERIAQTRYGNGLAPQQDVIKARTEQTALQTELLSLDATRMQAHARLNALLDRPALAPLAEPLELRPPPPLLNADDLDQRIRAGNPQLLIQAAQVAAARHGEALTAKDRYPDLSLGIAPMQRGSRLDAWELMLEINLPLQLSARRNRESEAFMMRSAADQRARALASRTAGELQVALATFEAARKQQNLLASELVPQAETTLNSALASYQTGKVDFATLLDAQRGIRRARLDLLKAQVELEMRRTEIENLVGEEL